ncbi:TerC family protein [Methylocella tundrae]|uniref:Uncharacterized membrane protein YjbE n=1 Tax=Methylocella tundrae TaxID=227605 RepID=A0A4U8YWB9_METTU|nr:TerC family protein [Methylocella tundrae]WPP05293.1 TerC family protein [Methylocella tundrae]VFU07644.1 Uncharacterized membrane protein YjbE [Methylocella tundrae]
MDSASTEFLTALLQIIWIDIVLSDDNALVIAMASRSLPKRQRRWAIVLGASAAVLLRIIYTLLFLQALALPFIKIAGGAILMMIAIRLVGEEEREEEAAAPTSIWSSIRIIVIADAVMSLDNVIAVAGAAQGSMALIIFGLVLSIPLVVLGSTFLIALLERFPALVWIGAGILGWVAGELIGSDPALAGFLRKNAVVVETWQFAAVAAAMVLFFSGLRVRRKASA